MSLADLLNEGKISRLLKIAILGTSGSGKTSFLRTLFGDFSLTDVERKRSLEKKANLTYVPISTDGSSSTTISLNQIGAVIIFTMSNQLEFYTISEGANNLFERTDIDYLMTFSIFEAAGQERFEFMANICLKGSDGIILIADGTNITSIEYLNHYIAMIRSEERRRKRKIPTVIFVNKSDLKENGLYLGADPARCATQNKFEVFETSIKDPDSFELPIRILVEQIRRNQSS